MQQQDVAVSLDPCRLRWLERTGHLRRRTLFLDLNHWIKLAERRDARYRELGATLERLVGEGKLICPVSPSLVMELWKNPRMEKRDAYCALMDRLSSGLSLRVSPLVVHDELVCRLLGRGITRAVAYSCVWGAVGDPHLMAPAGAWTREALARLAASVFSELAGRTVADIVNASELEASREPRTKALADSWAALCEDEAAARPREGRIAATTIERAEFAAAVRLNAPRIARAVLTAVRREGRAMEGMTREAAAAHLQACPTFWCEYKVLAAMRANRDRVAVNDLWDLHHVTTAAPHVDCLACDGPTRHLLVQVLKADLRFETRIVSRAEEVMQWLATTA